MSKIAIVYFSRKGQNYWAGNIRTLEKGNTQRVAEFIHNAVGGEMFEIVPGKTYPSDYYACCDEAKNELHRHAAVEPASYMEGLDKCDVVFAGYPNWWGTIPMAVDTFLRHYRWSGKRVFPFCTNEGSGMGGSVRSIKEACPGAIVDDGLAVTGHLVDQSEKAVADWARSCCRENGSFVG